MSRPTIQVPGSQILTNQETDNPMTSSRKLVPVEPTTEMLDAGFIADRDAMIEGPALGWNSSTLDARYLQRACWAAMLSASPQPPVEGISSAQAQSISPREVRLSRILDRWRALWMMLGGDSFDGIEPRYREIGDHIQSETKLALAPRTCASCGARDADPRPWTSQGALCPDCEDTLSQPHVAQTAEASSRDHEKPPVEAWKPDREAVARIAELEAALRPFAIAAENLDETDKDEWPLWEHGAAMSISIENLRVAAKALAPALPSQPVVGGNHE